VTCKYGAIKTTVDGITFASKGEANRYAELKLMQAAGLISQLELQPEYLIVVNGVRIGSYIADFRYIENGELITEDFKGVKTPVYQLKKKLVKALYGVTIRETRA